ncbi:MAG: transposon-transfer assisting family protein [Eubacteriales bacterium]|nr:transposon-transfer assisting family protein [Eubacteriales bacterium]
MRKFDENEYLIMAMFEKENRQQTMREIRGVIPFLKEDAEMLALVNSTLDKMGRISDRDFSAMDLEPYRQEPMEDE